jgi:hypothetical protein
MSESLSRERLLAACFSNIPSKIQELKLRPLSPRSFDLLNDLGNVMIAGGGRSQSPLEAVIEYIWLHSAAIDEVIEIEKVEDLPVNDLRRLGLTIEFGEAMAFLERYTEGAMRMKAALAELEDEDEDEGKSEQSHTGLHPLFSRSEAPEIPSGSDTSSGSSPSNAPSPISMPPISLTEQPAAGPSISMETETRPTPKPFSTPSGGDGW